MQLAAGVPSGVLNRLRSLVFARRAYRELRDLELNQQMRIRTVVELDLRRLDTTRVRDVSGPNYLGYAFFSISAQLVYVMTAPDTAQVCDFGDLTHLGCVIFNGPMQTRVHDFSSPKYLECAVFSGITLLGRGIFSGSAQLGYVISVLGCVIFSDPTQTLV